MSQDPNEKSNVLPFGLSRAVAAAGQRKELDEKLVRDLEAAMGQRPEVAVPQVQEQMRKRCAALQAMRLDPDPEDFRIALRGHDGVLVEVDREGSLVTREGGNTPYPQELYDAGREALLERTKAAMPHDSDVPEDTKLGPQGKEVRLYTTQLSVDEAQLANFLGYELETVYLHLSTDRLHRLAETIADWLRKNIHVRVVDE